MYTLALDTTGYKIHLVLLKNDAVIFERDWRSNMNEDETITKTIEHLQELEPFFTQKLTKVIVSEGPGTLTGTRVGVTMANALASAVHAPMVKLTSHDVWPMRLREEDKQLKPHCLLRVTENELYVDGEVMELKDAVKMITKSIGKGKNKHQFMAYGELTPTQFSQLNKIKGLIWIIETDLLSFGKVVEQIKDKGDKKLAKPRYAHPPVITESKKEQLVAPVKLDSLPDFIPTRAKASAVPVPAPVSVPKKVEKVITKKSIKPLKKVVIKKVPAKKVVKKPSKPVKKVVVKKTLTKKIQPKKPLGRLASLKKSLAQKFKKQFKSLTAKPKSKSKPEKKTTSSKKKR